MDSKPTNPEEQMNPEITADNSAALSNEKSELQEENSSSNPETPTAVHAASEVQITEETVSPVTVKTETPVAEVADTPLEQPVKEAKIPAEEPLVPHHEEEIAHLDVIAEHHEEVEALPLESFGHMSKEELVTKMEALSKENDLNAVKNSVYAAREAFLTIFNQEKDLAFASFIEAGGVKEDFDYKDALEERLSEAYKYFQKRRSEFVLGQEKIRTENLRQKNEILQQMKNILQKEEDMLKAFNEFHDLQAKWRSIGPVPPQNVNDLWMTYKLYSDRFYEFIRLNRELQDLEMKKNLEMKMHLCEKAEELLLEPSLNKALQDIQALQHKWREIGAVPREKRTEIWVRFKAAVDKIFENKRSYLDSQKKFFDDNFNAKNELVAKVEEFLKEKFDKHQHWQDGLKRLLELQGEWRKIGPAGKEHNDSIWHKFKTSCDQFFKNKDEFYKSKKQEYATNLQAKTELCIQAESLKESSDWKNTANELIRLQQEWKKLGPAGSQNEKIWHRFKAACDDFFGRKTAHFSDQDQAQSGNLEQKNELIKAVEEFALPADPNEAIEQLKTFQRKFTEIGLVPLKQKDDIQQRFRAAIQVHFDALKAKPEYKQSYRQRQDRPERNERSERSYKPQHQDGGGNDEQRNLLSKVNKLTGEVQLWENNLGFFANSKNAAALRQEYEDKIQQAKDEINKLKVKLQELKSAS
ncbi:MAG: DUF349 domain-containing protein [Bacteroidetes bacterium]|nr:DUF349 domain-containing protein [Bacteroidota bacterium]